MSLSARIRSAQADANLTNRGCRSCTWLRSVNQETKDLINEWIDSEHSLMQLFGIISAADDDDESYVPLGVSFTAWRDHIKHHNERCRGDK